jgi:hypothetical protein
MGGDSKDVMPSVSRICQAFIVSPANPTGQFGCSSADKTFFTGGRIWFTMRASVPQDWT